jgi:phage shock protein C
MNQNKKLYRSQSNVMLGGVCAGLGDYLGIDPTIVRLIFVVLFLTASFGFWLYLLLWIIVPQEPVASGQASHAVIDAQPLDEEEVNHD